MNQIEQNFQQWKEERIGGWWKVFIVYTCAITASLIVTALLAIVFAVVAEVVK